MKGPEQRAVENLQVLAVGLVREVARGEGVGVVGRRQRRAVGTCVPEAALVHPAGAHQQVAPGWQVAIEAAAGLDAVDPGGDDLGEAPERDDAPAGAGGEELPVAEGVAERGVSDVVGGEADPVDPQQRLTVPDLRNRLVDQVGGRQVIAGDEQVPAVGCCSGVHEPERT
jgi:hypothetical protein